MINTSSLQARSDIQVEQFVAELLMPQVEMLTYEQIEDALRAHGIDPYEAGEFYEAILDVLIGRGVLVVDQLPGAEPVRDMDKEALDDAAEVMDLLKRSSYDPDLYRHPILSAERERRLLEIYQDGLRAARLLDETDTYTAKQRNAFEQRYEAGRRALDELVRCNFRLVLKLAVPVARFAKHLTLDDLVQEGRMGFFKAIERFDLNTKLRLSTYATWWIRQSISRAMADCDREIRLPVHMVEEQSRVRRTQTHLTITLGYEPTTQQLAQSLGMTEERLQKILHWSQRPRSLDQVTSADGDTRFGDLLPDPSFLDPIDTIEIEELRSALLQVLDELTERERCILIMRYGLDGNERCTLATIGERLGLTRERIRQIEVKALRKLGAPRLLRQLQGFYMLDTPVLVNQNQGSL